MLFNLCFRKRHIVRCQQLSYVFNDGGFEIQVTESDYEPHVVQFTRGRETVMFILEFLQFCRESCRIKTDDTLTSLILWANGTTANGCMN